MQGEGYTVKIPQIPGKIIRSARKETIYILFEIGRKYDPARKFNIPERVQIGIQTPEDPERMIPNENYDRYFPHGEESAEWIAEIRKDTKEREFKYTLRDLFEQLYHEFRNQSRKDGGKVVNEEKVEMLNRVLKPMREMMREEDYAEFLQEIPAPRWIEGEKEGEAGHLAGMNYGDVMLIMTQYNSAIGRYFMQEMQ